MKQAETVQTYTSNHVALKKEKDDDDVIVHNTCRNNNIGLYTYMSSWPPVWLLVR